MVFEGGGGWVASNYWSCLGLLCVRGALRLFEREKRVVTIPALGSRLPAVPREFCRAGAGGECNAMRIAQLADHAHAQTHMEFTSICQVVESMLLDPLHPPRPRLR